MDTLSISILDLILLVVTIGLAFRNLMKGPVKSIFSFLGINVAYLVAALYYKSIASKVGLLINPSVAWLDLVGFSILFLTVLILFAIMEMTVLQTFVAKPTSQEIGHIFAFILGLLEGFLLCSAVLWFLQHDTLPFAKAIFHNSIFAPYYLNYNPLLIGLDNLLDLEVFEGTKIFLGN